MLKKRWLKEGKGELLNNWNDFIKKTTYETKCPRLGWALVSKEVIPESLNKDYLDQIQIIIDELKNKVFKGLEMPDEYSKAIVEFEKKKDFLVKLYQRAKYEELLLEMDKLKINSLTRRGWVEVVYDLLVYHDTHNKHLLSDSLEMTSSYFSSSSDFICLGKFNKNGIRHGSHTPYTKATDMSSLLSRIL